MPYINLDKTCWQEDELPEYDFHRIETKWQYSWGKDESYFLEIETHVPRLFYDNYGYIQGPETKLIIRRPEIDSLGDMLKKHGVDALRFYTLAMAPDNNFKWQHNDISEVSRFMEWIWIRGIKLVEMVLVARHISCIPRVNDDRDQLLLIKLNKIITAANTEIDEYYFYIVANGLRELSNDLHDYLIPNDPNEELVGTIIINLIKVLSIFCPFLCEELWQHFGYETSIIDHPWPTIVSDATSEHFF